MSCAKSTTSCSLMHRYYSLSHLLPKWPATYPLGCKSCFIANSNVIIWSILVCFHKWPVEWDRTLSVHLMLLYNMLEWWPDIFPVRLCPKFVSWSCYFQDWLSLWRIIPRWLLLNHRWTHFFRSGKGGLSCRRLNLNNSLRILPPITTILNR